MADLIAALANPAFGPVPAWVELGKDGKPLDAQAVFKMPEQTKIYCPIGKKHDLQASVSQCNAESLEHFLAFTDDQWKKQVVQRLPDELKQDGKTLFKIWPLVLGVPATAAWKRVLEDNHVDENDESTLTFEKFQECRICYCSELAGTKYPGDSVIRWLRLWKKPAWMTPEEYLRRRATVLAYLHTGLLRSKLSMPSAYDLAEAVFLGMPKAHQEKYAEKHDEVETDLVALKNAFSQYHAADVRNGALARILQERESKKRGSKPSGSSREKRRRTGRRDSSGGRGGGHFHRDRRDQRDQRDDRRDFRGRDRREDNRSGDKNNRPGRKDGNFKGSGGQKPFKKTDTAHHIDDDARSASSRSRTASRSSSPRRSPSPSYAEEEDDAYMAEETAYVASQGSDHRAPQLPIEELEYSDEEKSRHAAYFNSRKPRKGWRSLLPSAGSKRLGSAPR